MILLYLGIGILITEYVFIIYQRKKVLKIGAKGEKKVNSILSSLPKRKYKIINNIIFQTPKGTTQIDHIVVSKYGVFVIETKNYKGIIYGDEGREYWVQNLSGEKHSFYNPIRQNMAHIRAVRKYTKKYEKLPVISMIAFSDQCMLDVYTYTQVVYFSQLYRAIRRYRRRRISKRTRDEIYQSLLDAGLSTRQEQKDHRSFVKENVREYGNKIKHRICPRCGHRLVKRRRNHSRVLVCKNRKYCSFLYYPEKNKK